MITSALGNLDAPVEGGCRVFTYSICAVLCFFAYFNNVGPTVPRQLIGTVALWIAVLPNSISFRGLFMH